MKHCLVVDDSRVIRKVACKILEALNYETDEAEDRIRLLRAHGPTPAAFTFRQTFPPPDGSGAAGEAVESAAGNPDWLCPA